MCIQQNSMISTFSIQATIFVLICEKSDNLCVVKIDWSPSSEVWDFSCYYIFFINSSLSRIIGHLMEKIEAGHALHRAFSVFLFNSKYELLLQVYTQYHIWLSCFKIYCRFHFSLCPPESLTVVHFVTFSNQVGRVTCCYYY